MSRRATAAVGLLAVAVLLALLAGREAAHGQGSAAAPMPPSMGGFAPGAFVQRGWMPGAMKPGAARSGESVPGAVVQHAVVQRAWMPGAFTPLASTPSASTPTASVPSDSIPSPSTPPPAAAVLFAPAAAATATSSDAPLGFTPPAPGSYRLERILQVPDGAVLDSDGSAQRLQAFTTGRITVFSFIYTYCADPQGCPLAAANLHALQGMLGANPRLRGQVRFVSMSFDPAFDNPAMMRSYGADDARPGAPVPWHFLTTASNTQLAPILAGFGQDVQVLASGDPAQRVPLLRHLLKVHLIDRDGVVREIYSPVYLHPRVLYNDIVTLLQQGR